MMRWWWVNLALAVYTGALLLLLLWPDTGPAPGTTLTVLDAATVSRIRVERDDRLRLAFERREGVWHMIHPKTAVAATRRVAQLLAIAAAPLQQTVADAGQAARYGLQPPAAVLQLDDQRLAFGASDPEQRLRYVRTGERIAVIDDLYYHLLQLPATHFLDPEKSR